MRQLNVAIYNNGLPTVDIPITNELCNTVVGDYFWSDDGPRELYEVLNKEEVSINETAYIRFRLQEVGTLRGGLYPKGRMDIPSGTMAPVETVLPNGAELLFALSYSAQDGMRMWSKNECIGETFYNQKHVMGFYTFK